MEVEMYVVIRRRGAAIVSYVILKMTFLLLTIRRVCLQPNYEIT